MYLCYKIVLLLCYIVIVVIQKIALLCTLRCLVIRSGFFLGFFFVFFFNFSTSAPLHPSKYDVCHVLQKLGHINPKGFFNPRLLYQKMNHDGNNIIIFMLHSFAIELCYVYACIAFVKLLILYCNKVFEISSLCVHRVGWWRWGMGCLLWVHGVVVARYGVSTVSS